MKEENKKIEGPDKQVITRNQNSIWPPLRGWYNIRTWFMEGFGVELFIKPGLETR